MDIVDGSAMVFHRFVEKDGGYSSRTTPGSSSADVGETGVGVANGAGGGWDYSDGSSDSGSIRRVKGPAVGLEGQWNAGFNTSSSSTTKTLESSGAGERRDHKQGKCCSCSGPKAFCGRCREGAVWFWDDLRGIGQGVDVKGWGRRAFSVATIKNTLPIIKWIPKYRFKHFQGDLIAGLTVGLTVIPQGLAYAKVAGLSPEYGLYSAFMGCFVYLFLGSAKDVTLGPTAIMSLLTSEFGDSPKVNDPTYAILISFIGGFIQLAMGILHIGFVVDYISHPVINSFTTAAAINIAWGQVKQVRSIKWGDVQSMSKTRRTLKYAVWLFTTSRNAVVVVVTAGIAAGFLAHDIKPFTLTGPIKPGLPAWQAPSFTFTDGNVTMSTATVFSNIGVGFVIVPILGLVEIIAIGKAFARKNNYDIDPDQELLAIGVSNILGSFVGAYPVTGSFTRTAVNSQSGVMTPLGGIWTAALVLLTLAFLTPLIYYIPTAALAAVIIMAVMDLIDFTLLPKLWKIKKIDIIPWLVTFCTCLFWSLEYGICIGVALSLLMLTYPYSKPQVVLELSYANNDMYEVLTVDQGLMFPGIERFTEKVHRKALRSGKSVILDMRGIPDADYTSIEGVEQLIKDFRKQNKQLILCNLRPNVLDLYIRAKMKNFEHADTIEDAIKLINRVPVDGSTPTTVYITPTADGRALAPTEGCSKDDDVVMTAGYDEMTPTDGSDSLESAEQTKEKLKEELFDQSESKL